MAISEFDIISTYFNKPGLVPDSAQQQHLPLGIGDDCALLSVPAEKQLAMSMDVLVADVHFPVDANSALLAQRALAVNLSDLAAMGARPMAFTLGLSLPDVDEQWLEGFSKGLTLSAQKYRCPLIGGDMTKGPLSITIQVHGLVDAGKAIKRSGACPGDKVYVTGTLGEAGLALKVLNNTLDKITPAEANILKQAYYQPEPRLTTGLASVGLASAAIDISDGLLADLGHIASQSKVGMRIELDKVPVSSTVQSLVGLDKALQYALSAGDDYELALTVAAEQAEMFEAKVEKCGVQLSHIGTVTAGTEVSCIDAAGNSVMLLVQGYQHF